MQASLGRPFDTLADWHLAKAGIGLLAGAIGAAGTVALMIAVALAWLAAVALIYWAIGALRPPEALRGRLAVTAAIATGLVAAVHLAGARGPTPAVTTADASRSVAKHLLSVVQGVQDQVRFRAELLDDPVARLPSDRLLGRLRDVDVLLLIVESYGRSTLENPLYASAMRHAMADFDEAARAAGFAARSAWLRSPIQGGQSWLAHATLLSGLRIDRQRRHERLVLSDRQTLIGDFHRSGWRTLAVMPAVERPWPQAAFFGFDRVYAASDLGYAGARFNWVTMPDQYTLSALQRLELGRRDRPAIMATVALVSSHAPWTPIPPVLDWDAIGDGSVFTPHARAGDAPEVVWRDTDRIRAQYFGSIDYVLRVLMAYVAAYGRDDTLFVIVGDHQPVAWVAGGDTASFDVPIHLLSRDPAVLGATADWGWSAGMWPDAAAPVWLMEDFRQRFLAGFSEGPS
ncbi:MAG: hypothetical protein LT102_03815 [Burkholderiaceae bacterium]|nr:hypothetical protein [Burkholderiaceae bacterium]